MPLPRWQTNNVHSSPLLAKITIDNQFPPIVDNPSPFNQPNLMFTDKTTTQTEIWKQTNIHKQQQH